MPSHGATRRRQVFHDHVQREDVGFGGVVKIGSCHGQEHRSGKNQPGVGRNQGLGPLRHKEQSTMRENVTAEAVKCVLLAVCRRC